MSLLSNIRTALWCPLVHEQIESRGLVKEEKPTGSQFSKAEMLTQSPEKVLDLGLIEQRHGTEDLLQALQAQQGDALPFLFLS